MIRFLRFAAIGVVNTAIDFAVFAALTLILGTAPLLANLISYSCGVVTSFIGNRRITFRGDASPIRSPWLRFGAFYAANLAGLLLASALVLLLEPSLGAVLAKAVSIPLTLLFNFAFARRILSSRPARQPRPT